MNKSGPTLCALAAASALLVASGSAKAMVTIDITQSGGGVEVSASGSLDLTGATFDHAQPYSTGIIPGGDNWYIALGVTPGMDWYQLTSVTLPYGTDGTYFTSGLTSGDAFSIWGFAGGAPLVGVATGYTSGGAISASMTLAGEAIAGMTLMPGTYTFTVPNDTVVLHIAEVPEASTWTMLALGLAGVGFARRRAVRRAAAA